jgi:pectinesterase
MKNTPLLTYLSIVALLFSAVKVSADGLEANASPSPSASASPAASQIKAPKVTFTPGKVHIVLAGDSTVTDNAGWGKGFAEAFKDDVQVINLSKGGRSSGSFIKEGSWKKALDLHPDYVLIQFGHNDQPGHKERTTDPATTYRQNMTVYVDEAKAAGIKPVLVTSVCRREWTKDGKINSSLAPYADVVKQIAQEKKIPLVDLQAISKAYYEKEGKEKILEFSPMKNADPGNPNADTSGQKVDGTHFNEKGGVVFGKIVADEFAVVVPEMAPRLK